MAAILARYMELTTLLFVIDSSHQSMPQCDINTYNHYFIDTIKVLK